MLCLFLSSFETVLLHDSFGLTYTSLTYLSTVLYIHCILCIVNIKLVSTQQEKLFPIFLKLGQTVGSNNLYLGRVGNLAN